MNICMYETSSRRDIVHSAYYNQPLKENSFLACSNIASFTTGLLYMHVVLEGPVHAAPGVDSAKRRLFASRPGSHRASPYTVFEA